jgi:hypothetical protein
MSFWRWLKRDKKTEATERPKKERFPATANAIDPEWRSGWSADTTDLTETRRHVGVSEEGFHPGIEEVLRVGANRIVWGDAYPTPEMACGVAGELERERHQLIEKADSRLSPGMIAHRLAALLDELRQESILARQKDESGRKPGMASVPKTRSQEQQPKRERWKSKNIHSQQER